MEILSSMRAAFRDRASRHSHGDDGAGSSASSAQVKPSTAPSYSPPGAIPPGGTPGLYGSSPEPPERDNQAIDREVPYALRVGAAWSWRLAIIVVVCIGLYQLISFFSVLIVPLMLAALLAGLLSPLVRLLHVKAHIPKGLAVAIVEIGFIVAVIGTLALVGRQIVIGFTQLGGQVRRGYDQIIEWLQNGPLHLTTTQMDAYIQQGFEALRGQQNEIASGALSLGSTAGHLAAGVLLTLFSLIFFLLEGDRIWRFVVGLVPKRARAALDGAGRRGWQSMVTWVRVQILVAAVDAVGIGLGAAILGVPLALPLAVLVFIGSFIPIVGALVTGAIAAILALVALGWVQALIMLGIVLLVHQLESHVLQPLVMGRAVSLHPLAVVLAVTGGTLVAGIAGALFAVPLLAVVNSAVRYLSGRQWERDPAIVGSSGDGYGVRAGSMNPIREENAVSGADKFTAEINTEPASTEPGTNHPGSASPPPPVRNSEGDRP